MTFTNIEDILDFGLQFSKTFPSFDWNDGIKVVLSVWVNINVKTVSEIKRKEVEKVIKDYIKGYSNRPSVRESNPVGTIPDRVIDTLISGRLDWLPEKEVNKIKWGHRLSMSAENILGLILEEYLSDRLFDFGWYCCWGNAIRAVDFCTENLNLLQVKNRSNTENSSSSAIRSGTDIKKWFRINAQNGKSNWEELNYLTGANGCSEGDFQKYAYELIKRNPKALFVEDELLESFK